MCSPRSFGYDQNTLVTYIRKWIQAVCCTLWNDHSIYIQWKPFAARVFNIFLHNIFKNMDSK